MPTAVDRLPHRPTAPARDYLLAALGAGLGCLLALGVSRWLDLPNISLVFLAVVLVVAARSSIGPALLCALLSFAAYGFCFLPPTWSVVVHREQDVLTLLFFLLIALLTGNLAARQRQQFRDLQVAQRQTESLLGFAERLSSAQDQHDLLAAMLSQLDLPAERLCLLSRDTQGHWQQANGSPLALSELERISAEHAWQSRRPRGYDSHSLTHPHWWWWPLMDGDQPLALLGMRTAQGDPPAGEQRQLIDVLLPLLAHALARVQLVETLGQTRLQHETERLRSALLASVSHDLRTPLTAMRGNIETLQLFIDSLDAATRDDLLQSTASEASRLDRYIQNLLDMTRLGHGGLHLERDWVAAGDLLAAALQRLQPVLQPLRLHLEVPADLPLLWVQGALIEQALVNVLDNAARFSPPAGVIDIRLSHDGETFCFAISDQGPGIPVEEQAQIFDLFYTAARGDRGGQGTGLGLAICLGMLNAHGGTARVESAPGQGTTLILQLPLQQPAEDSRHD
ncbi:ATP-binding protein [Pseudomonas sp. G34]|uniref:ATP-binding protein n=1 Tax=Pseudomonas sp. G34 TaxID=3059083 RepID=UPI0028069CF2|nr:ATP-binding protein [Pseudomonas sp. G34]MDQ7983583.1 ATP-binding protein [Pseudomonas sp. G34]